MRKTVLLIILLLPLFVACGSAETVEVEVTREVVVTREVEVVKEVTVEVPLTVVVDRKIEVTRIVEVTPVATDTPKPPPTSTPSPADSAVIGEAIVLERTDYSGDNVVSVITFVENPNADWWIPNSEFVVNIYDADGNIVGTDEVYFVLPPGGTVTVLADNINIANLKPAKVEFTYLADQMRPASKYPNAVPELVQANLVGDKIVGQVTNNGDVEIPRVRITILFKDADGKYLAAKATTARDVLPGRNIPFDMSLWLDADILDFMDSYEIHLEAEILPGTMY